MKSKTKQAYKYTVNPPQVAINIRTLGTSEEHIEERMESRHDRRTESFLDKATYMEGACSSIVLKTKMAELHKTKEDLTQAKDHAIESWLASKPLIDELEKQQKGLEIAKNRSTMSNIVVSELESQLEATIMSINSKREEELEARALINQIKDELDEIQEEMEQMKMETDEERRERSKLKQVLLMRRQTLEALQLTQRAIRLELEAVGASAAEALEHINRSQSDNTTVQLNVEEYDALTRSADEETFLTDWRVLVSTEQRLAAQDSRDLAFKRLEKLYYPANDLKQNKVEEEITGDPGSVAKQDEKEDSGIINSAGNGKLVDEASPRSQQQLTDVSGSSSSGDKKSVKKKKPSVFAQIRNFVVHIT